MNKAICLCGGHGTRLFPITKSVPKSLLPLYDKPMIYYPLSVLMLSGIRDILIITTPEDSDSFKRLLGDGHQIGIKLTYAVQPKPEGLAQAFIIGEECGFLTNDDPCALILGDNIFHGSGFRTKLNRARWNSSGHVNGDTILDTKDDGRATIFCCEVNDPQRYGIAEIDKCTGEVISIEEKPEHPKSNLCVTGLYFYPAGVVNIAKNVKPSARGELEITSVNQKYLEMNKLRMENLGLGFAWLDSGTFDSLSEASNYIETIEKRQGTQVACIEEIAYENHWIPKDMLIEMGENMKNNNYGQYLLKIAKRED